MNMCSREDRETERTEGHSLHPKQLGLKRRSGGGIYGRFRALVLLGAKMDFILASVFLGGLWMSSLLCCLYFDKIVSVVFCFRFLGQGFSV